MANRTKRKRDVFMSVDEGFFKVFENERQKEQTKLRKKMGGMFNLSQRNFTSILAKKKFKFQIPKQKRIVKGRKLK